MIDTLSNLVLQSVIDIERNDHPLSLLSLLFPFPLIRIPSTVSLAGLNHGIVA